jgi:hypothetical protein
MCRAFMLCLVGMAAVWLVGKFIFSGIFYSVTSRQASPDGQMTIHEFRSHDEGGHAPYGKVLALSRQSKIDRPEEGDVFFAGYCQGTLEYSWKDAKNIMVRCGLKSPADESIRTRSSIVRGIRIQYMIE